MTVHFHENSRPKAWHENVHTEIHRFLLFSLLPWAKKRRRQKPPRQRSIIFQKNKTQVYVVVEWLNFDHGYIYIYWKSMELSVQLTYLNRNGERSMKMLECRKIDTVLPCRKFSGEIFSGTNCRYSGLLHWILSLVYTDTYTPIQVYSQAIGNICFG